MLISMPMAVTIAVLDKGDTAVWMPATVYMANDVVMVRPETFPRWIA